MTMAVLTFVAFLVGIFSTCSSTAEESTFTFELNGISHTETRKVEGSIVTLTDAIDGFLVVLDYERNMFVLKNLTSQKCSFTRLDNIPVEEDAKVAIFVEEVTETSLQEIGAQEIDVVLLEAGEIPAGYVRLTNDVAVAELCSFQPSHWLKTENTSRQRRQQKCRWDEWGSWKCAVENTGKVYQTVKVVSDIFSWWG